MHSNIKYVPPDKFLPIDISLWSKYYHNYSVYEGVFYLPSRLNVKLNIEERKKLYYLRGKLLDILHNIRN